jgi:hypothetical protein
VSLTSQNYGIFGPIVHPRVICDLDHIMIILTEANSQLVYQSPLAATSAVWRSCPQRHPWQHPVLAGCPAIRDISGASGTAGEGNENLVYPYPWGFKRSFICPKILRHGTSGFTFHPKESVLRNFIALKIHRFGRIRTRNLWAQWQAH